MTDKDAERVVVARRLLWERDAATLLKAAALLDADAHPRLAVEVEDIAKRIDILYRRLNAPE